VALQTVVVAERRRPDLQDGFAAGSVVPEFLGPFHPLIEFFDERFHEGRRDRQAIATIGRIARGSVLRF